MEISLSRPDLTAHCRTIVTLMIEAVVNTYIPAEEYTTDDQSLVLFLSLHLLRKKLLI